MKHVQTFRSLEDARRAQERGHGYKFNYERAKKLFDEVGGVVSIPYKKGLYKFSSLEEAREFEIEQYARQAAKKARKK